MKSVSVVIPNYNRSQLVTETIANMLNQSLPPHEVIVVDDGSTDNSVQAIRSFGSRVTLIQQENHGPGAARNAGLAIATGEYIQFMDSDDLTSLNKIELQAQALEKTNADMAYSPWAKVYIEQQHTIQFQDHVLQKKPLPNSLSILEWFLSGWSIVLQACLFRRSFLMKTDPFSPDLLGFEDTEYMVRLFAVSPKVTFVPECLTLYRLHNEQKLTESGTSQLRRLQDRILSHPQFWKILVQNHPKINPFVKLNFGFQSWSIWNAMHQAGCFSETEKSRIEKLWQFYPVAFWNLFSYFRRGMIRLRWQITGSRWIYPYQSADPFPEDYELLQAMGFQVKP